MERKEMGERLKVVFVVYAVDDWSNEAVFSLKSDAEAWIARQKDPANYNIEELPIDLCIDGYDVYIVTLDARNNNWNIFISNTSFEGLPSLYGNNEWWGVNIREKTKEAALTRGKELILTAIDENG